jgi:hypothetical protein
MKLCSRYSTHTLRLELPCGHTMGLALILFSLLVALGEVLVRAHVFRAHVVADNRGGRHGQFELQLGRLETVVARDGPIDCIFLGNSMVWHSLDPEAFAQSYRRQTGQDIHCFNFGVDGLPTVAAGALASVLASEYQPALLIYGTTARDYAVGKESEDNTVLLEMSWLRYRLGQFSVRGWFYDHSRLYQYWGTLGHLLRLEKRSLLLTGYYASLKDNYGFYGHEGVGTVVSTSLDAQSEDRQIQGYFDLLSEYEMLPENLAGLEQVMVQNNGDVQVLVVEMPLQPTYLHFFGKGQQDYQRFIDTVAEMATSRAVPFWRTTQLDLIPGEGWYDYIYPNTEGAWIFSAWLGEQVGSAVLQGKLRDPVAEH